MKSINIFWLLTLICVANGYAQGPTGINTTNPKQQLHVSGTTGSTQINTSGIFTVKPTIRIEGLNITNNIVNNAAFGAYALPPLLNAAPYSASPYTWSASPLVQPVSVTQDGDMLLSRDYVIPLAATKLGNDELTGVPNIIVNATTGTNQNFKEQILKAAGYTFTIRQTCMVHFLASVSVSVYQSGGTKLTDGLAKSYRAFFRFSTVPAGSGLSTTANFGTDGNSYTNNVPALGLDQGASGDMYMQPEAYLVLKPGTYKVDLFGYGNGYNFPARFTFGAGTADMVSIIATPIN